MEELLKTTESFLQAIKDGGLISQWYYDYRINQVRKNNDELISVGTMLFNMYRYKEGMQFDFFRNKITEILNVK